MTKFTLLSPLLLCLAAAPVTAQTQRHAHFSEWVKTAGAQVRLVTAPVTDRRPETWQSAGIEIRLDQGAKTYWRSPGDSGVPPTVSFAESKGVHQFALRFPAPTAFDDGAGGVAIGYRESLILPVWYRFQPPPVQQVSSGGFFSRKVDPPPVVTPKLALTIDFGVCVKAMCMPAQAALAAEPGQGPLEAGLGDRLIDAFRRVPAQKKIGDEGPVGLSALTVRRTGDKVEYSVSVRVGGETGSAAVFIEAKDAYVGKMLGAPIGGSAMFRAEGRQAPDAPLGEGRITVVTATQAIEVKVDLDAAAR